MPVYEIPVEGVVRIDADSAEEALTFACRKYGERYTLVEGVPWPSSEERGVLRAEARLTPASLRELPMTPELRVALRERRRERRRLAAANAKGMVGVGAVGLAIFGSLTVLAWYHNNMAAMIFLTLALPAFFGLLQGVRDLRRVRSHRRQGEHGELDRDLLDPVTVGAAESPTAGAWWAAHTAAAEPEAQRITVERTSG